MVRKNHRFDWSSLTRQQIFNHFMQLAPKIVDKELTPIRIQKIFLTHAQKLAPITISRHQSMETDHQYVYIGGQYDSDYDSQSQIPIALIFQYHPFDDLISISFKKFKRSCMLIADTILHEIIHMRQYRRRDFASRPDYKSTATSERKRNEQGYMGNYDEIDAYSFNVACELYHHFKTDNKSVYRYLDSSNKHNKKSPIYKWYLKTFDYDHNHPVIKKLKTKVIKYLPMAALGKPYKNNDWIWY